jgi:glucose-1-phosphate cytidylyltransferase
MKVVLFCGGLGTRLRELSETIPKPLATIGPDPILLHLMRYYAHFGHTEFICCLGYGGDRIREYFAARPADCAGWTVHLVDTGLTASIAERLLAVAPFLQDDEMFLANYSDGLCDVFLPAYVDAFRASNAVAGFVAARMSQSYHFVAIDDTGRVEALTPACQSDVWVNGGFFAFRPAIFDYLEGADELVGSAFARMVRDGCLYGYRHRGFWASMDTYKDKVRLDRLYAAGRAPWKVWAAATSPVASEAEHA